VTDGNAFGAERTEVWRTPGRERDKVDETFVEKSACVLFDSVISVLIEVNYGRAK